MTLVLEIASIVGNENVILALGQGKIPVSLLSDEVCEELAFSYLFPNGKFGYKVERDVSITPGQCFNQRCASDPD